MMDGQKLWTREELILVINLYFKLPFGKLHSTNSEILELAQLLGRSPGAVAFKLVNFASLDTSIIESGRKGAGNVSKLDKQIWFEFFDKWEALSIESEKIRAKFTNSSVEFLNHIPEFELPLEGETRNQIIKARVNQNYFRKIVLAAYNNTCCITGLQLPELLIAGHIVPWGKDEKNRLNPRNGIAINPLHDKAFENGLLTITIDYKVKISSEINKLKSERLRNEFFFKYNGKDIIKPSRWLPGKEFLELHFDKCFKK